ncbi:MAG: hypothetical protein ABI895_30840 [Deltaproteobacteria bacterium]
MANSNATSARAKDADNNAASKKEPVSPAHTTVGRRPGERTSTNRSGATAERDDTYGLISVIYHSLQGAETCAKYEADARRAKNHELVTFFEDCRIELNERAVLGRSLLAAYLEGIDDDEEDEIVDDDEELEAGR